MASCSWRHVSNASVVEDGEDEKREGLRATRQHSSVDKLFALKYTKQKPNITIMTIHVQSYDRSKGPSTLQRYFSRREARKFAKQLSTIEWERHVHTGAWVIFLAPRWILHASVILAAWSCLNFERETLAIFAHTRIHSEDCSKFLIHYCACIWTFKVLTLHTSWKSANENCLICWQILSWAFILVQ